MTNGYSTKYPNLFASTYWGRFEVSNGTRRAIKARNKFAEEFKLARRIIVSRRAFRIVELLGVPAFDHAEYYYTKTRSIVVIASNYVSVQQALDIGFELHRKSLYSDNTQTVFKVFENQRALAAFVRSIEKGVRS
jgi:hypothetical protein